MGMALTPFSLLAVTFVLGIGIDSAVFLHADKSSMPAILVAWLTTVLGTGVLLLANHPVIWSLGVMLSIGMTAAFIAALLVTPALRRAAART
jgi:predicted exporter